MDSIYDNNNRQPAPPSVPPVSSFWQSGVHLHEMEYQYSVAPPTHNITSPPTTPMTPGFGPPPPLHGNNAGNNQVYQSSAPALSHSSWPPEFRIYSLCQEIQHILSKPNVSDNNLSWEQFCVEYFHEMATMIIEVNFGNGRKRYTLQGNLVLWYFKSIVESGIAHFDVKFGSKVSHSCQQQIQRIECGEARQELEFKFPHHTKVCSDGQLVLEFTMEDKPRIMTWYFHINNHVEMIPRYSVQTAEVDLSKNLTCQGLPPSTQSILVQLGMRPHPPVPLQVQQHKQQTTTTNMWDTPTVAGGGTIPQQQGHEIITDSSILLHQLPPPPTNNTHHHHVTTPSGDIIPSLPTLSHHHIVPHSPPLPPLSLSPVISNGSTSYGSTCSIMSNSNIVMGSNVVSRPPPLAVQQSAGSQKVAGNSTAVVSKRNELVMVASEPSLFSADMVHGFDERKITRVDNHTKRVVTTTSPSLATPSSTTSEIDPNPPTNLLTNQNSSLTWINSAIRDWNGHAPPHTDQ